MRRQDIKVGMRVRPSGKGFTKYWNLSVDGGEVIRIGRNYILVRWDNRAPTGNLKPLHLEPECE